MCLYLCGSLVLSLIKLLEAQVLASSSVEKVHISHFATLLSHMAQSLNNLWCCLQGQELKLVPDLMERV